MPLDQLIVKRAVDDIEIVPVNDGCDTLGAYYYADSGKTMDRDPGFVLDTLLNLILSGSYSF